MAYSAGASPLPPPPPSPGASGNRTSQHVVGGMSSNLAYMTGADLLKARQGFNEAGLNSGALNRGFFNGQAPQEALDFSQQNTNQMQAGQGLSGGQAVANTLQQHTLGNIRPANAPGGLGFGRSNSLGIVRQHTLTGNEVTGGNYTPSPTPPPAPVAPPPPPVPASGVTVPTPINEGGAKGTAPVGTTNIITDNGWYWATDAAGNKTTKLGQVTGPGAGGVNTVPVGTPPPAPPLAPGTSTGTFGGGAPVAGPTAAEIEAAAARQREADQRALAEQQARLQAEATTAAQKLQAQRVAEAEQQRILEEQHKAEAAVAQAREAARVAEQQRLAQIEANKPHITISTAQANFKRMYPGVALTQTIGGNVVRTSQWQDYLNKVVII